MTDLRQSSASGGQGSLLLEEVSCGAGHRVLFEGLSLKLQAGQWAALRGHNGSGKSTLLRGLAGLSPLLDGKVRRTGSQLYQSHSAGWKDLLTPSENLDWQARLDGQPASPPERLGALETVGIAAQADLSFARLSAGQKRRVSMARLVLSRADLWLLDEPTTALDTQGQQLFADILAGHLKRGGLAVLATHLDIPGLPAQFNITLGEA